MDLRVYYQKIRKIEAELTEPFVVVVSRRTEEGGRAGVKSEVPKKLAAKLIAEEKAVVASTEEAAEFRAEQERKWKESHDAAEAVDKMARIATKPLKKA
ncbi:MAG: hypothetical protein JO307_25395 [Bryobacterales bacterium]|nr:hypothetical protein [Bryobacterales bacterium]MBV9397571.1 hypothetical protein [Bryobacterales bacterium]